MREKIVLIDGHSILNRAFYGVPDIDKCGRTAYQCDIWVFEYYVQNIR